MLIAFVCWELIEDAAGVPWGSWSWKSCNGDAWRYVEHVDIELLKYHIEISFIIYNLHLTFINLYLMLLDHCSNLWDFCPLVRCLIWRIWISIAPHPITRGDRIAARD